ncbi:MAG: peroxide stress protein YaaA [Gammaproteobacteria bacterium]|nr:MAG: peroxide stress protein YaaA [Gammaproteobacteria bacterium]
MLILLSPAKTLDMDSPSRIDAPSTPAWLEQSSELVKVLRDRSPQELGRLMGISEKLATLNAERFANWNAATIRSGGEGVRPAIEAFRGDVYTGLDVDTLDSDDIDFADEHLRMLSGLYGILKPRDLMQAYRLEMGTPLATDRGKDLHQFWRERLTRAINRELAESDNPFVVNLASNEYFSAIREKDIEAPVISPVFHDEKNGEYKIISFFAKKARGAMARYLIQQRAVHIEDIKGFNLLGYRYVKSRSSDTAPLFRRSEKASERYRAG